MKRMGRFDAYATAKLSRTGAVGGVTPKEIEQWILQLHPLNVRTAHIAAAGVDAVAVDARAISIHGAMRHVDKGRIAPVLIHARMAAVAVARAWRDDFLAPPLAGSDHLHQDRAGKKSDAESGRRSAHGDRPGKLHMHQRSLGRDDLNGLDHALILRQIVSDGIKDRAKAKAESAVKRQIDAFAHLRVSPSKIENELVVLLAQGQN